MGSVKMIVMSSGGVLMAILVSLSLNPALPTVWSTLSSWLTPTYLYVIINGIIISIAASSRLHHNKYHDVQAEAEAEEEHYSQQQHSDSYYGVVSVKDVDVDVDVDTQSGIAHQVKSPVLEFEGVQHETDIEMSAESFVQKPPPLSRFAPRPRPAKSSPAQGGKAWRRVAKTKRHETLESTWKAITEGRAMPLTRHLKKSDTWENHSRQINLLGSSDPAVKKSETFKQRTNNIPPLVSSSRLKKEPSLSQDELNRRVEAFINKFNEEMRLQRQQSIEQFMDKINRI